VRVVLDTNILGSALHSGGRPRRLLQVVLQGERHLIIESATLRELEAVLVEACGWSSDRACAACGELAALGEVVSPAEVPRLCRDPDDDEILAIASLQLQATLSGA
jgi:predicted nucleic acid-binding protein